MKDLDIEVKRAVGHGLHWFVAQPPWVVGLTMLAYLTLVLWAHWRIVKRAGYPGCWSLMLLVPCVNFIFLAGFAFAKWPVEKRGS